MKASLGLFQSDVNVIWDLAVHDISIIQYLLNRARPIGPWSQPVSARERRSAPMRPSRAALPLAWRIVGAGAVVTKDVPAKAVVAGVAARISPPSKAALFIDAARGSA